LNADSRYVSSSLPLTAQEDKLLRREIILHRRYARPFLLFLDELHEKWLEAVVACIYVLKMDL
jgi:hypothetical protein